MILDRNKDILSIIKKELDYDLYEGVNAEYEIELGYELVYDLIYQQKMFCDILTFNTLVYHKTDKLTLFGKPLRINYNDPFVFKLWKNIV